MSATADNRDEIDDSSAPLIEHLAELRTRLIWSVLAFIGAMVVGYVLWGTVYNFLTQPICSAHHTTSGNRVGPRDTGLSGWGMTMGNPLGP